MILEAGAPEYSMGSWDASVGMWGAPYIADPLSGLEVPAYMPGMDAVDMWGVRWIFEGNAPGAHPSHEPCDTVVTDIAKWRDQLSVPHDFSVGWSETEAFVEGIDRKERLVVSMLFPGILERFVTLMGFEQAMLALVDDPEEAGSLLDAICDVKIAVFDETYKHVKPDMIESHDDWGYKSALTMSVEMWREFIKPRTKRFYRHVLDKGVTISHHSDCYAEPLAGDMIELGISIWQGATPANNIQAIKKQANGKLTIMGGIDSTVVDAPRAAEEEIREEVRRAIREYAPGGFYIPCVTSEVAFNPGAQTIVDDEIRKADVRLWR